MKDIKILSREAAHKFLQQPENKDYDILLITDPYEDYLVEEIKKLCKKTCLHLEFHDIEFDRQYKENADNVYYYTSPKKIHVEKALEWSVGKEKIVCTCMAGVSRSSSLAYSIMCARVEPNKAIKALNLNKHRPNRLVTKHAADVLGNQEIDKVSEDFRNKVDMG